MLLVKTKIGPSKIHGIGLFADQFIAKGVPVWKFAPGFDLEIPAEKISELSEPAQKEFLNYAYLNHKTNKYILCFDYGRFVNHSDTPNMVDSNPDDDAAPDIAVRNIEEGEELTSNYQGWDDKKYTGIKGAKR